MVEKNHSRRRRVLKAAGATTIGSILLPGVGASKEESLQEYMSDLEQKHGEVVEKNVHWENKPTTVQITFDDGFELLATIEKVRPNRFQIRISDRVFEKKTLSQAEKRSHLQRVIDKNEFSATANSQSDDYQSVTIGSYGLLAQDLETSTEKIKTGAATSPPAGAATYQQGTEIGASGAAVPLTNRGGIVKIWRDFTVEEGTSGEQEGTIEFNPSYEFEYKLNSLLDGTAQFGVKMKLIDLSNGNETLESTVITEEFQGTGAGGTKEPSDAGVAEINEPVTAGNNYRLLFKLRGVASVADIGFFSQSIVDGAKNEGIEAAPEPHYFETGNWTFSWS